MLVSPELARARVTRTLDEELEIRDRRVAELRRSVTGVGEVVGGLGRWSKTPSPTASPPKRPWSVLLREQPTRAYTIKLVGTVARTMMDEVRSSGHGDEVGGYLWNFERPSRDTAAVVWANGPGAGSLHGPRSFMFPAKEDVRRYLMPDWLDPEEKLRIVGDWHSHPRGAGVPSRQDLNLWASALWCDRHLDEYVSVILTRGRASGPTFSGYFTHRLAHDRFVTEPAFVDDPDSYGST